MKLTTLVLSILASLTMASASAEEVSAILNEFGIKQFACHADGVVRENGNNFHEAFFISDVSKAGAYSQVLSALGVTYILSWKNAIAQKGYKFLGATLDKPTVMIQDITCIQYGR